MLFLISSFFQICGSGSSQTIHTVDARLTELGLSQYPTLPAKTDPSKIEEIRRTIYVGNLDPAVSINGIGQNFQSPGLIFRLELLHGCLLFRFIIRVFVSLITTSPTRFPVAELHVNTVSIVNLSNIALLTTLSSKLNKPLFFYVSVAAESMKAD